MDPVATYDAPVYRRWYLLLAVLLVTGLLIFQLRPILSPFIIGALIAYLGDPLADRLQAWGCSRAVAATLVFLSIASLLLVILLVTLPLLAQQLDILVGKLPGLYDWFAGEAIPWLQQKLDLPQRQLPADAFKEQVAKNWQSVGKLMATIGAYVTGSGVNFLVSLGNLVLIPVVAFYLLRDWDILKPKALGLLPLSWQATVRVLAAECDEVIGAFLRGQFLVMLGLAAIYATGLWLVGLELAFLIGVLAGLASVVPYLGALVGIVCAGAAALMQFQDASVLIWVALVFFVGQTIEGYLLTPNLVGDRIGLHPVAVIFAILAGGQLAGLVGILLALPVAAVIMVFLRHVHDYYVGSVIYADTVAPVARTDAE